MPAASEFAVSRPSVVSTRFFARRINGRDRWRVPLRSGWTVEGDLDAVKPEAPKVKSKFD